MRADLILESLRRARRIHGILCLLCILHLALIIAVEIPSDSPTTVSAFGIDISDPLIMMALSFSLIPICCFYLGVHLKHLRELNQFQPVDKDRTEHFRAIARAFPWVMLFSGWEAGTVTFASILLLPSVATYAIDALPLLRFAFLLPCLYTAWQAHMLRHRLFENVR